MIPRVVGTGVPSCGLGPRFVGEDSEGSEHNFHESGSHTLGTMRFLEPVSTTNRMRVIN